MEIERPAPNLPESKVVVTVPLGQYDAWFRAVPLALDGVPLRASVLSGEHVERVLRGVDRSRKSIPRVKPGHTPEGARRVFIS